MRLSFWKKSEPGVVLRFPSLYPSRVEIDDRLPPYIPIGWRVKSHRTRTRSLKCDLAQSRLVQAERQKRGEEISGHDFLKALKHVDKYYFNATTLDWLLENPRCIPVEWKGRHIFFPWTVYENEEGHEFIRFLFWHEERGWQWFYWWLGFEVWGKDQYAPASR